MFSCGIGGNLVSMWCKLDFRAINFRRDFFAFSVGICFSQFNTSQAALLFWKKLPIQNCDQFSFLSSDGDKSGGNIKHSKSVDRRKVVHTFCRLIFYSRNFAHSADANGSHWWCGSQSKNGFSTSCNSCCTSYSPSLSPLWMWTAEWNKVEQYLEETFLLSIRNSNIWSFFSSLGLCHYTHYPNDNALTR